MIHGHHLQNTLHHHHVNGFRRRYSRGIFGMHERAVNGEGKDGKEIYKERNKEGMGPSEGPSAGEIGGPLHQGRRKQGRGERL